MNNTTDSQLCYYCYELCEPMSSNPGRWPIPLCHAEEPGKVKYHHIDCVSIRLLKNNQFVDVLMEVEKHLQWVLRKVGMLPEHREQIKTLTDKINFSLYQSPEKQNAAELVRSTNNQIMVLHRKVAQIQRDCQHKFAPFTEEEKNDEWFSKSARCILCDARDLGWRCKKSFNGVCEYVAYNEDCIWCGMPSERK